MVHVIRTVHFAFWWYFLWNSWKNEHKEKLDKRRALFKTSSPSKGTTVVTMVGGSKKQPLWWWMILQQIVDHVCRWQTFCQICHLIKLLFTCMVQNLWDFVAHWTNNTNPSFVVACPEVTSILMMIVVLVGDTMRMTAVRILMMGWWYVTSRYHLTVMWDTVCVLNNKKMDLLPMYGVCTVVQYSMYCMCVYTPCSLPKTWCLPVSHRVGSEESFLDLAYSYYIQYNKTPSIASRQDCYSTMTRCDGNPT